MPFGRTKSILFQIFRPVFAFRGTRINQPAVGRNGRSQRSESTGFHRLNFGTRLPALLNSMSLNSGISSAIGCQNLMESHCQAAQGSRSRKKRLRSPCVAIVVGSADGVFVMKG